jgi:hypothetical protein
MHCDYRKFEQYIRLAFEFKLLTNYPFCQTPINDIRAVRSLPGLFTNYENK